ncbi:MAG: cytochrome P450 [Myxococcales bacterium]|nr:cytochrome P450 [Myxococcales bacterium]
MNLASALHARPRPWMPATSSLLGHLPDYSRDPLAFTDGLLRSGHDVVFCRFGWVRSYFVFDADIAHHVLVGNAANYGKNTRGIRKLKLLLGRGLLTNQGDAWRRQRRIAQPAFRRKAINALGEIMVNAAQQSAARFAARGAHVDDITRELNALTLRIAAETLFSVDIGDDGARVAESLTTALAHFPRLVTAPLPYPELLPTPGNLRFHLAVRSIDQIVCRIIEQRRRELERGGEHKADLLGLLMEARDPESGEAMSDRQLRDEVVTMMLAGHETTANALAFTLMMLGKHPDVAAEVEHEIDTVIGGRAPTAADVMQLRRTRSVLFESMRLYPPAWTTVRTAEGADRLGEYPISKGAYVYISPYALHRSPRYWRDPDVFRPERFDDEEQAKARPKLAFMPFGAGQRKCIGDHFAQLEATLVLAVLLRRLRFSALRGQLVELEPSVTLRPRGGLTMSVAPR